MILKPLSIVILLWWIIFSSGCAKVKDEISLFAQDQNPVFPSFAAEEEVIVQGYNSDMMEPFISGDNRYLFFNSLNDSINTSIYYARQIDPVTFIFEGEVAGVNGPAPHLDAVASMDNDNNFYFVSTRNYPAVLENYQGGDFNAGTVINVAPVEGDFYINIPGYLIMDGEISRNGRFLYYVNASFSGGSMPDTAELGIAEKTDTGFSSLPLAKTILKNINNEDYLVYAPSLSADGRELYFTRFKKGSSTGPEICVSVRSSINDIFNSPKVLDIPGFAVEAPTITEDGQRIYYHKKSAIDGKYHLYTRKKL